ncbi:MAG: PAS domain-containing sensor histidine kinase [Actinomycetota bacterium]|nr:PAS domain-containing sensor histidine kinase [Actinomycetota bacterium]
MRLLRLDRRAVLGALVGAGTALLSAWLAGPQPTYLPFTVLLVLAIALIGLALGANAAAWAYVAGSIVIIAEALAPNAGSWAGSDTIRFIAFLLGSPAIVFLVYRAEANRALADGALAASDEARREADAERERMETARRELDVALTNAERERARLEEVAEAIPEPLIVYDDEPRGTYGNRAALRLFGRSFVERPLEEWGRATEPRDEQGTPLERDEWPQVRAQREPFRRRMTLRIPMSGRDVIADTEGTPIPGGGAVLLLRDIGKEEDERRRLSRFASFVAHELRNPLAVAKARIELAQRDPAQSSRAAGHGSRALESVDAAIGILERLELYSRADSGHIEARREAFELAPALGAAIERLRARGSERALRVDIPDGVAVLGDRHLSEQAITNLLTNADRYSTPGGAIHVAVRDGDLVTLRVRDEGPGVADDVARRLFHDRVAAGRGLGLGLYLVRATMEAMGGSVQLEEKMPAAVFALRWPRSSE